MAWDPSRPVPYRRLAKEWLIYAAVMVVVFLLFLRDSTNIGGMVLGLLVSLPLWLGISYVLAKFGYQRKTMAELRAARTGSVPSAPGTSTQAVPGAAVSRPRPAPTRRTSAGPNRPPRRRR